MPPTIHWLGYWLGLTVSLLAGWFSIDRSAFAQIIPDNTLPINSQVAPGCTVCTIDGGTQVGGNLFHSFSEFSISTGGAALFNNTLAIQNILTRVTGGIPSQIDGLIQANGSANLFLLNPSGIHFGANASLNLGGSFFASTADSFRFADGSEFSASNPQAPPLLTVNIIPGLQYGSTNPASSLVNRGLLIVGAGQSLTLQGGDVVINNAIGVPGGNVSLIAARDVILDGANSRVVTLGGNVFLSSGRNLTLANAAFVRTAAIAAGNSGNIQVQAGTLTIASGAQINASSSGVGNGGAIVITANDILLDGATGTNFASIQTQLLPGAIGNAGQIDVTTGSLSVINGAVLSASTAGQGNAGSIVIRARDAVRLDGVNNNGLPSRFVVGVNFPAVGNGGRLDIAAKSVTVANGAFLSAGSGGGLGNGGRITIQADDSVTFDRGDVRLAISPDAIGNGGTLDITAPTITLTNESVFDADTSGLGNAGTVRFQANQVVGDRSVITTSVASGGVGNGGTIGIQAATIDFNSTVLLANTAGQGDAGDIALQASQSILLDNTSIVDSSVLLNAVGNGGTIAVTTGLLTINNQSLLSAFSGGQGAAGDIQVQATNLRINDGGSIATISLTGNGGNISLNIADSIILRNNSDITVTALGDGDGGRISITAGGFILALLNEDSDIFANAVTGSGGRIFARATGIYGFRLYEGVNTPESDFFADSRSGVDGIIEIQTPPAPGLNSQSLPVLDPTNQIAQNCRPAGETGRFVVTGRGGLPPSPAEIVVGGNTLWEDVENQTSGAAIPQAANVSSLTPAQGWVVNDRGDVTLVATMPSSYCDRR